MDARQEHKRKYSKLRLAGITCALAGVQLVASLNVGNSTKTFRELGLSSKWVAAAWLAGPISGSLVQPVVGVWSDSLTSRWGRRSPFLAAGALIIVVALAAFSNAAALGTASGEHTSDCAGNTCPLALGIAVAAFCILDVAFNTVKGPARTLLVDLVPRKQQAEGNAFFAAMTGCGSVLGFALGSLPLADAFPFLGTNLRATYTIGMAAVVGTVGTTLWVANEAKAIARQKNALVVPVSVDDEQHGGRGGREGLMTDEESAPLIGEREGTLQVVVEREDGNGNREGEGEGEGWRAALSSMPVTLKHVFAVQCTTWFAWFTTFIYAASWVGTTVYGGNPDDAEGTHLRDRYEEGVRMGNLGLLLQAVVTVILAVPTPWTPALLPAIGRHIGLKALYMLAHAVLGLALLGVGVVSYFAHQGAPTDHLLPITLAIFASLGLPWATTMTVPWAITAVCIEHSPSKGLLMSVMNQAQCIPEIVAAGVGFSLLSIPSNTLGAGSVMASGGVVALLGILLIAVFRVGDGIRAFD